MIRSTFEALIEGLNAFGQRIDEFCASIQRRRPIEALGQKCGMEIVDARGCHHTGKTGEYHCHGPAYVGVASVIDGDTIEIHGQRFRISGIDAPEAKQLCNDVKGKAYRSGQLAANARAAWIGPQIVSCVKVDIDRYQRIVAECSVVGEDVGRYMVANGLAVTYRKYSTACVSDEKAAHANEIGIWPGTFEMRRHWRKAH